MLQEREVQLAEAAAVLRDVKKGHSVRAEALAAEKADVVGELEASFRRVFGADDELAVMIPSFGEGL